MCSYESVVICYLKPYVPVMIHVICIQIPVMIYNFAGCYATYWHTVHCKPHCVISCIFLDVRPNYKVCFYFLDLVIQKKSKKARHLWSNASHPNGKLLLNMTLVTPLLCQQQQKHSHLIEYLPLKLNRLMFIALLWCQFWMKFWWDTTVQSLRKYERITKTAASTCKLCHVAGLCSHAHDLK